MGATSWSEAQLSVTIVVYKRRCCRDRRDRRDRRAARAHRRGARWQQPTSHHTTSRRHGLHESGDARAPAAIAHRRQCVRSVCTALAATLAAALVSTVAAALAAVLAATVAAAFATDVAAQLARGSDASEPEISLRRRRGGGPRWLGHGSRGHVAPADRSHALNHRSPHLAVRSDGDRTCL